MTDIPRIAEITIRFTSWWQGGTGAAGGRDTDMAAYKDDDGCPALPMTQVKGTVRDIAANFDLLTIEDEILYFGERTQRDADHAEGAAIRFAGEARLLAAERAFFKANPAARAQLFSDIASTAIDAARGTALTDSLRRAEIVVPLTLTARVEWVQEAPPDDWIERLNAICAFTPAFGKLKNDGFGRAIASCAPAKGESNSQPGSATEAAASGADEDRVLVLNLEADDPFVFSRTAATEGGHHTLTAPTGAALLGWAAGQLYESLDPKSAYTIFHSGRVHFSDAVPIDGGRPTFPRPAILLKPKHGKGKIALGRDAFETAHGPDVQAEPISMTPVTLEGAAGTGPRLRHRLRTAIEDGKAKAGALFGYESVSTSGREFRATVDDPEHALSDEEWQLLHRAFVGRHLHLGRGRRSGYGGSFSCTRGGAGPWPKPRLPIAGKPIRIWALSDLCLVDDHGNPNLSPKATDFGLEQGWEPVSAETTVTTRRIWPWNSHLKTRDLEMVVIEAGSVFSFAWNGPDAPQQPPDEIVGQNCGRGLGRVAVIPDDFEFRELEEAAEAEVHAAPVDPPTPLAKWAQAKAHEAASSAEIDEWVEKCVARLNGIVALLAPRGPSRSQWSSLVQIASAADVKQALKHEDWQDSLLIGDSPIPLWKLIERDLFTDNPHGSGAVKCVVNQVRQSVQELGR
jgi:hypothetical protein